VISSWFLFFSYHKDARSNKHQFHSNVRWLLELTAQQNGKCFIYKDSLNERVSTDSF